MRGSPKPAAEAFHEEITPIAEKDLEVLTQIGSGSFGQVFSARWKKKNNMMVAVKFVNMDKKKEFEAELQSLTNVHHPNIVRLYGASIAPPKFHMVMELCATSLQAYIRKNNYEVTDVYRWSYQTADVRPRGTERTPGSGGVDRKHRDRGGAHKRSHEQASGTGAHRRGQRTAC